MAALSAIVSPSLITALAVQVTCQLFKVAFYSVRERRLRPGYLFSAGGMPSAHSAFVTALSVSVGLRSGWASEVFGVALVFSVIVVYDSIRLRGAVQRHSRVLNRLLAHFPEEASERVSEMVGHTPAEVAAGVAAGGLLSVLAAVLFP
jgi:acid phosphatase family membrane protein YuiD